MRLNEILPVSEIPYKPIMQTPYFLLMICGLDVMWSRRLVTSWPQNGDPQGRFGQCSGVFFTGIVNEFYMYLHICCFIQINKKLLKPLPFVRLVFLFFLSPTTWRKMARQLMRINMVSLFGEFLLKHVAQTGLYSCVTTSITFAS